MISRFLGLIVEKLFKMYFNDFLNETRSFYASIMIAIMLCINNQFQLAFYWKMRTFYKFVGTILLSL